MARGKVRVIRERDVIWLATGMSEPITSGTLSAKPNAWPDSCWVCGETVAKGGGVVAFLHVRSRSESLAAIVHNTSLCKGAAKERCDELARDGAQALPLPAPAPVQHPIPDAIPGPGARPEDPREALRQWLGVKDEAPVNEARVRELVGELLEADNALVVDAVDARIREAVRDLDSLRPRVELRIGDKPPVTLPESRHAMMEEALAVLTCPERMLWLVGPTGTGKSYMARQLAEALGVHYYEQACYGASESALVGYATATGDYVATPVVQAVDYTREQGSKGALLCLDEIDGADESALLALNSLLAGDGVATPRRAGMGHTHRGGAPLYIVATANTEGSGYGTREYNARTKLDDATRDRLVRFRVWVDYDRAVEEAYVKATGLPAKVADGLWTIRAKVREHKLEGRHISTRAFKYLGEMHATHPGRWDADALLDKELATWTDEERAKIGFPRRAAR